jgi:hypothetical protein
MKALNLTGAAIALELPVRVTETERAPHTFFYIDVAQSAGNSGDSRCE